MMRAWMCGAKLSACCSRVPLCVLLTQRAAVRIDRLFYFMFAFALQAGNHLSSLVENAAINTMLTPDRVTRVCRVISTVQAYLVLE